MTDLLKGAHLAWELFWAEGSQEAVGSWGTFTSPLRNLIRGLAHSENYYQKKSFYDLSIEKGKLLIIESALTLLQWFCEGTHFILSSECLIYLILTFCPWASHVCGVPIWLFSLVKMSPVDLIIRSAARTLRVEESFLLPHILGEKMGF